MSGVGALCVLQSCDTAGLAVGQASGGQTSITAAKQPSRVRCLGCAGGYEPHGPGGWLEEVYDTVVQGHALWRGVDVGGAVVRAAYLCAAATEIVGSATG